MRCVSAFEAAVERIERFAATESIATSRLHALLPALALGVPVEFTPRDPTDRRFDGLDDLDTHTVRGMAVRLSEMVLRILPMILTGQSSSDIALAWRAATDLEVRAAKDKLELHRLVSLPPSAGGRRHDDESVQKSSVARIALAFDGALVEYVPALLRSIAANASCPVSVVCLVRGVQGQLDALRNIDGIDMIEFIHMDTRLAGLSIHLAPQTTVSTMDRLFLPELLPKDDRIIYLDIDTIVLGDVAELRDIDIPACGVVARPTPNAHSDILAKGIETAARTMLRDQARAFRRMVAASCDLWAPYFNAGVLVLSLAALRQQGFTACMLGLVERFGLNDQHALNIFANGQFGHLPDAWNAMPSSEWLKDPKLIHWAGATKPWFRGRPTAYSAHWRRYAEGQETDERRVKSPADPAVERERTRQGYRDYWAKKDSFSATWDLRAEMAASFVVPKRSVLDLGCGQMALRRFLPAGCRYVPADLVKWTDEVIPIDLDEDLFPPGRYDHIVSLGVFEYLSAPRKVLQWARESGSRLIVSFSHPTLGSDPGHRRKQRWINDYSDSEFEDMLADVGWSIMGRKLFKETKNVRQHIYLAT